MEAYAKVLLYAIPFFLILVIIEALYGWLAGKQTLRSMDTISSLSSGSTNTLKNIMGLTVIIFSYGWLESKIAIIHIEATWLVYVLAFIAIDFAGYCRHLLDHKVNFFWNEHVIHHSSEEFNLPCALRQSISNVLGIYAIFLVPAALLGLPPKVIAVISPIHLFMQFWYHTRHIPKLGFLEYIIVTPSAHRVHHAINPEYIDKNLSQIFIVWDRLFGTYQEEMDDVPPVYGIKKSAGTWNPVIINFQHVWRIFQDAWRTKNWMDKLRIWFMPTGWRPQDVSEKFPIEIIEDAYTQKKYDTEASSFLHAWSWVQYIVTTFFMVIMLINFSGLGVTNIMLYGAFIFISIYSYTTLMDRNPHALWMESVKNIIGLFLIYHTGSWIGIDTLIPFGNYLVGMYFVASSVIVTYFVLLEFRKEPKLATA